MTAPIRKLAITGGAVALVDDDTYQWAKDRRWHLSGGHPGKRYPARGRALPDAARRPDGRLRFTTEYLHRLVLGDPPAPDLHVDHINGNYLDCRRANLRWATRAQNQQNQAVARVDSITGVRGVQWDKSHRRYAAYLTVARRRIRLGYFPTLEEAGEAAAAGRAQHFTHAPESATGEQR